MRIAKKYVSIVEAITDWMGNLPVYVVMITVFTGFLNVILRYAGELTGTKLTNNVFIELQWYLYTLIFLLGFPYILRHQVNVRVDFWFADQSPKLKAKIDFIGHVIALIPYCLLALYVTWNPVMTSWGRRPSGEWCFNEETTSSIIGFVTYFLDIFDIAGRYCGEISPDPNGLNRAPIKSIILVAFLFLLLQGIAEMIRLVAIMRDQGHEFGIEQTDTEAPVRIE